jgi:hypothetical protein
MTASGETSAVAGLKMLAVRVVDWLRRQSERGLWQGGRRIVAEVCRCVCHLLHSTSDTPPARRVAPVVAAPTAGTHQGSILLRHAIVLRAPPAFA